MKHETREHYLLRRSGLAGSIRAAAIRSLTFGAILLAGFLGIVPLLPAVAQAQTSAEYQLKAAVIHKFLGFVDWPIHDPLQRSNLNEEICILGANPFGDALSRIARAQSRRGRGVSVRAIDAAGNASGCDIVYISTTEAHRLPETLEQLQEQHVLTVSDIPGFAYLGGMIELRLQNRYVRFAINQAAAESSGLKIRSQLLALATEVLGSRQGES